jgi:uncharacterized membrane protein
MNNVTLGVYQTHSEAEYAIKELMAFGIPQSDISYIYVDNKGEMTDGQTGEKVTAGAATGATTGAIVGGIAGLVVANGILPGLGSLFVAGPLAAALGLTGVAATTVAGAATGAAAGGLLGALTQLGVDDTDARLYESMVQKGDVLVVARSTTEGTKGVFEKTSAHEVREYVER